MTKVARLVRDTRPMPPADLNPLGFTPAADLTDWMHRTFIASDGVLANPTHAHLHGAEIGVLWTNVPNARAGRLILGQTQLMPPMAMGKWAKAMAEWQLMEWFGDIPDFLMTINATYALVASDLEFCALIEHELCHMAQALDEYGNPKFSKQTGSPIFALRGHDVEEFVDVVARYGAGATGVEAMVAAANRGPSVGAVNISMACGTCAAQRRA